MRGSRSFGAKNNDPLEVFVFTCLFERLFWLGRSVGHKPQRWGRKPCSQAKYHAKRGYNQGLSSTICVDEDLRILLANLLQSSSSTFSCISFPSYFAFQEGIWGTHISALLSSPTVSLRFPPQFGRLLTVRCFLYAYCGNPECPPRRSRRP